MLGIDITANMVIAGGVLTFLLLVFQVLVGKRVIKFKGPLHWKIHRWSAYAMVVVALVHGLAALTLLDRI